MNEEYYQARLLELTEVRSGTEVSVDHFIGDTTLDVYSVSTFSDEGGELEIEGVVYTYNTVDFDTDTIALATALTADVPVDTEVYTYPASIEKEALCQIDTEDAVATRVPHALVGSLEALIRDQVDEESVQLVFRNGEYVIDDIIAAPYRLTGDAIPPESVPTPIPPAPTITPAPVVDGSIKSLFVSWEPSGETYLLVAKVHIGTASGFTVDDATTLVATVNGTQAVITQMPDGTPLQAGVTYYIKVVFENESGTAPESVEASGMLKQIDTPDVSVNAAWVGTMRYDRLIGGAIQAVGVLAGDGGLVARGAGGEEVGLYPTGFQVKGSIALGRPIYVDFPASGKPNIISGILRATTLEVESDPLTGRALSLRGFSEIAAGGEFRIASALQAPINGPILTTEYGEFDIDWNGQPPILSSSSIQGAYYDTASSNIYFCDNTPGAARVYWMNLSGVVQGSQVLPLMNNGTVAGTPKLLGIVKVVNNWTTLHVGVQTAGGAPLLIAQRWSSTWGLLGTYYPVIGSASLLDNSAISVNVGTGTIQVITTSTSGYQVRDYLADGSSPLLLATILYNSTDRANHGPIVGLISGATDVGTRFVISFEKTIHVYSQVGDRVPNEEWPPAAALGGMVWDGTRFWALSRTSFKLLKHSTNKWTTESPKIWGSTTRYNAALGYESDQSARSSITMVKRAFLRATVAYSGAPGARLYLGRGATDPGRTNMERNATLASPESAVLIDAPVYGTTNVPPATSNFPADNPAQIISTDGGSYWKGDNTAKFLRLIVDSSTDASTAAGNLPALRIGNPTSAHLRIDNNEFIAMANDTTQGPMYLNAGHQVQIGTGSNLKGFGVGVDTINTDTNSEITIAHGCGQNPTAVVAVSGSAYNLFLVSKSATQATFRVRKMADGTLTGSGASVQIFWIAIAAV